MNRTFQFSIRWLLGILTTAAIVFGAFNTGTEWLAALLVRCIVVVAFGAIGTLVAVGGKYARPFGIGAAFPLAVGAIWAVEPIRDFPPNLKGIMDVETISTFLLAQGDIFDLKFRAGFLMAMAMLGGLSSVAVRSLLPDPPRNEDR